MKLHDKNRPRFTPGGNQYLLLSGSIVPSINLTFPEPGKVKLMVFLNTNGTTGYRDFNKFISTDKLSLYLQAFEEDPERCLIDWFGYNGPVKEVLPIPKPIAAKVVAGRIIPVLRKDRVKLPIKRGRVKLHV